MMTKKTSSMLLAALLAGCGTVNNIGVIGKNLDRAFSSHPYEVKEGQEKEILASGRRDS